jgi:hypothetical protein
MTKMSTTFCGAKLLILHEKVKKLKNPVKTRGYKLLILQEITNYFHFQRFFQ